MGLHIALLAAVLLFHAPQLSAPPVHAIAVDIVTSDELRALFPPKPQPTAPIPVQNDTIAEPIERAAPKLPEPLQTPSPKVDGDGMVHASHFFAAGILADPANAEVRETLPLFALDEQSVQICNMEALEQIADWKAGMHPDTLVPYAFAETRMVDGVVQVDGGAFRNAGQWYQIRFRCAVGADHRSVSRFEFAVGDLIPPSEWDEHFLNATDDP